MKNTKQISETVLKIRDAEQEKITIRNRRVKRSAAAASTFLVFCAVILAARHFHSSHVQIPTINDEQVIVSDTTTTISDTDNSTFESTAVEHPTKSTDKDSTSAEATENSTSITERAALVPTETRSAETSGAEKTGTNHTEASVPTTDHHARQDEAHTESSATNPVTESHSEGPPPSDITTSPVTEPVNIVQMDFKVNKIINQISGAPRFYSPDAYDTLSWSYDEVSAYYGKDYRSALNEIGFYTDEYNEYRIITDKNGNMADDKVNFLYNHSEGSVVKLSVSKIAFPYDSIFELESNETNNIQGTSVLIGGYPSPSDPNSYLFYYADFEKNNAHYRLTGNNISAQQFYETIEKIISK